MCSPGCMCLLVDALTRSDRGTLLLQAWARIRWDSVMQGVALRAMPLQVSLTLCVSQYYNAMYYYVSQCCKSAKTSVPKPGSLCIGWSCPANSEPDGSGIQNGKQVCWHRIPCKEPSRTSISSSCPAADMLWVTSNVWRHMDAWNEGLPMSAMLQDGLVAALEIGLERSDAVSKMDRNRLLHKFLEEEGIEVAAIPLNRQFAAGLARSR